MHRVWVAAVAGALSILLSGCSLYRPLPEPLTAEQVGSILRTQRADYWAIIAPGEPFPDVDVIEVLPPEESWPRVVECIEAMALPGVVVVRDSITVEDGADQAELERAFFVCQEAFPADYSDPAMYGEYYSTEELDYLWVYYTRYLVPCLRRNGYTIASPPARELFSESHYLAWFPYIELRPTPTTGDDWRRVDALCARPPVGPQWRPIADS